MSSFFDDYLTFDHHPRCSIRDEFNRLAKTQNWSKKQAAKKRAQCYNLEFESHFAKLKVSSQLERLQALCEELDVEIKGTITQCKKACSAPELAIWRSLFDDILKTTHVNLVDLMDSRRSGRKVKKFATAKLLVAYTVDANKIYPKKMAKGNVVQVLLKEMFFQRRK